MLMYSYAFVTRSMQRVADAVLAAGIPQTD
jgi:hypothetical protein